MLLISYDPNDNLYTLARNNGAGIAEKKQVHGSLIKTLLPDDGAVEALMALAREVPQQFHVVPNPQRKARRNWAREAVTL